MNIFTKSGILSIVLMTSTAFASNAFAADSLEIRDFIGTINWSNGDMSVDIEKNKGATKITGRSEVTINGGQDDIDGSKCKSSYGSFSVDWFGKEKSGRFGGYEDLENLPILNIRVPEGTTLIIRNSILFTEGAPDIREADLDLNHCGDVTLGDVTDTLALNSRGSADLTVGTTGQIAVSLKGSGDLTGTDSGDVIVQSQGSGDLDLGNLGSLEAKLKGSGDLEALNVSGNVDLSSHGSGDIDLDEVSGSLTYKGHGSGDLEVDSLIAPQATLSSRGSGDIDIGDGRVDVLTVTSRGSSNVEFSGNAERADLSASGSGNIRVERVTGDVEIRSSGSGNVDIEDRS